MLFVGVFWSLLTASPFAVIVKDDITAISSAVVLSDQEMNELWVRVVTCS